MPPSASTTPSPVPVPAVPAPAGSVRFAAAARVLGRVARDGGLVVPGFRSPPRVLGVQRSLRRHHGGVTVAVQVRDRPWPAVVADMIEGVVVTNGLQSPAADRLRTELWQAVTDEGVLVGDAGAHAPAATTGPRSRPSSAARVA
jgi:hypothetical protein